MSPEKVDQLSQCSFEEVYRQLLTRYYIYLEIIAVPEWTTNILPTFKRNWGSHVIQPALKRNSRLGAALIDLL